MSLSYRGTSRFTLLAEAALAALVVLCPLALGGAASWLLWPLMALSGAAAVLAAVGAKRQGQSLRFPLLAVPLAAGAALCAVQLVPLPAGVLGVLSPEAAALREFALVPLGLEGARPVSLDPTATWRELSKHLAYLLAFLATVQVCRSRRSRVRLLAVLAFTGAALAVVGLGHALVGVKSLFGLMSWVHARPTLVTPFGNPNHLAGFLGLASTVALGLALTTRPRSRALPYALAAAAGGLGVMLSLSRGGIAFFVFGQALLALLLLLRRRHETTGRAPPVWARSAAALLGLLAVLAVGAYTAADRLWAEARTADSVEELRQSKVSLWPMMAEAARAFPVLGMGRGAFESAFPRYQSAPNPNTFTHPENAVLQAAVELGVPGLLLLGLAAWGFARLLRREGLDALELAALAGVAGLALHDLFDFALELPASAVAALVVLGAVARPRRGRADGKPGGVRPSPLLLGASVALAGLGLVALVPGRHAVADAEAELAGLVASRAPLEDVRSRGLALIDRHPSDYLLYRLVASAYAAHGRESAGEALAFVNRALYLAPRDAVAHRVAARALLALGRPSQGFLEYRLAHEAGDATVLLSEALRRARTVEEVAALTPDAPEMAVRLLDSLANTAGRLELARAYSSWARERFEGRPGLAALWVREARLRLRQRELDGAEAACAEVERLEPEALESHLLRAEVLRAQGRREEALQTLERLLARFPGHVELSFTLAHQQLEAGLTRRAKDTLQAVSPFLTDYAQRARLLSLEASCLEREGLLSRAVERRLTAARLAPGPDAWFAVARTQESLRRYDAAARSVHEGMRMLPPGARKDAEAWAARLEAAERARVDTRRKELQQDPNAEELEHLLRNTGGSGEAADDAR
ncbi:tetratricopeptide repeat protein [Pyxidicoccus fallax]|uniref:Tetratricopeptide repeat protein n=1 Tax=Pyxidicoccus fallax TaxID=394095 RepID=A0A848LXF0_9BACT|nr:O-antigen ligase family protein [Pyxidicoccus fallax]NMO22222.1 tetratricopeptide repeat protein [Pyxidicoccus fallax]NPC85544.1 tetratricopeptide repeat protein [Pyxidicoccus fallax]